MPYSIPALPPAPLPIHSTGRPGHRRAYTAPSSGPGAFAPLGVLPRRRSKKTVFHLNNDDDEDDSSNNNSADEHNNNGARSPHDRHDDDDDDDVLHNIPPILKLKPNNSFRLAIYNNVNGDDDDDGNAPVVAPRVTMRSLRAASVPFPVSSPLSPTPLPPPSSPSANAELRTPRSNVTRTTSTPIFLSNGKPLKSSLKSSSSSPHITLPSPPPPQQQLQTQQPPSHLRARSAPSTPNVDQHPVHKNVHFPSNEEGGLATVKIFNRSAKPASLSRPPGDETETETEGELSTGSGSYYANSGFIRGASAVFPFPRSPLGGTSQDKGSSGHSIPSASVGYQVKPTDSSPIPALHPAPYANVYLESLSYNTTPGSNGKVPPGLSGTLLVRNIAYEKQVAVRFTLDDWQTTSEVSAKHHSSLPSLPLSFVESRSLTYGDILALPPNSTPSSSSTLGSGAPQWDRFVFHIKLEDYAVKLAQRTLFLVIRYTAGCAPGSVESWDNNAGKNYKIAFREVKATTMTPTERLRSRVFAVSSPPSFAPTAPTIPSPTITQPHHAQSMAQTTLLRLRKLNLRNYAAPASAPAPSSSNINVSSTSTASPSSSSASTVSALGAAASGSEVPSSQGGSDTPVVQVVGTSGEGEGTSKSESDSDEEEDEVKTPTGYQTRSRTPSPVTITVTDTERDDPAGGPRSRSDLFVNGGDKHPLSTLTSPSSTESSTPTPSPRLSIPSSSSTPTASDNGLDIPRPPMLSPLEMGTSPPFSMMADLGSTFSTKRGLNNFPSLPATTGTIRKDDTTPKAAANAPVYWPWGTMLAATTAATPLAAISPTSMAAAAAAASAASAANTPAGPGTALLAGIREKSTSSPVRRVSPSGLSSPVGRSSSPVKDSTAAGKESSGSSGAGTGKVTNPSTVVVSPQPRMPNWSKAGSGWNRKPSPPSSSTTTGAGVGHPRASPVYLPTSTTRAQSPLKSSSSSSLVPPPTTNHQDSVYQAFVRQWCFAQGPAGSVNSPVPGQTPVHSTGPARYGGTGNGNANATAGSEGKKEGKTADGQLVV